MDSCKKSHGSTVLQIPIARSPEATCFWTGLPTPRGRQPWRATSKHHISASICPKELYNHSICSENGQISPLKTSDFQFFCPFLLKMVILCQSGLLTFVQGYLIFGVGRPQDYGQIFTSLQHWALYCT